MFVYTSVTARILGSLFIANVTRLRIRCALELHVKCTQEKSGLKTSGHIKGDRWQSDVGVDMMLRFISPWNHLFYGASMTFSCDLININHVTINKSD